MKKGKCFILVALVLLSQPIIAQEIHVNQVGYSTTDEKDFRSNFSASTFELINSSGTAVYQGTVTGPVWDEPAEENVWIGAFSQYNVPGTYSIRIGQTSSPTFEINDNMYQDLLESSLEGIYGSRCGYAVRHPDVGHPKCHLDIGSHLFKDGNLIPVDRDAIGGWHNGGDYRKSSLSHAQAVNRMLEIAELFPNSFDAVRSTLDEDERIPGMPDLLTEAKWGIDWLLKMMNSNGAVSIGLGPDVPGQPGQVAPQNDTSPYYFGTAYSSNTGKTGAVLARAARIYADYDPAFAQLCEQKAVLAWDNLNQNGKYGNPNTVLSYRFNRTSEDDFLWLSMELYINTGEEKYHDKFKELFDTLDSAYPDEVVSTHTMREYSLSEVLLRYCTIKGRTIDDNIKNSIISAVQTKLAPYVNRTHSDGYGNLLPPAFWSHRHTIGNMLHKGWALIMAYEAIGDEQYKEAAIDQLHFLLGRNALGKVFVTGLGTNPVERPHYRPWTISNKAQRGLPVKGPTHDPGYLSKNYTAGNIPAPAKTYVDAYGRHWVNEPDIEVMGYFIAFSGYLLAERSESKYNLVVKAKGDVGGEVMKLLENDVQVGNDVSLTKQYANYTFKITDKEAAFKVVFENPTNPASGVDYNMQLDYIDIDEIVLQAEDQPNNTGSYNKKTKGCGGAMSERLVCQGYVEFQCQANLNSKSKAKKGKIKLYPNPVRDGMVNVRFSKKISPPDIIRVYDKGLNVMLEKSDLQLSEDSYLQLNVSGLTKGVYILRAISKSNSHSTKLIIK